MTDRPNQTSRFARQMVFEPLGPEGQAALARGRVLIIGVGGLGSWAAELLVRAGVGFVRLVDNDLVDITNIHRQGLYDEADAQSHTPKVAAAAVRLAQLHSAAQIEPVAQRVDTHNIQRLAENVQVIVDGTDNFATRFLINDYCVRAGLPWVFAGVVRSEAQTAVILPGRTPCLRCFLPEPPPVCQDMTCNAAGVMGMAVSAVASFQAMETVKILTGHLECVSPYLLKFDLWTNEFQRIRLTDQRNPACPCCGQRVWEYLEP
jgi:molybdopterin-synthase adenylyltransferase